MANSLMLTPKAISQCALLYTAEAQFQAFITGDRNLSFEQNLPNITLAVIVLEAPSIRLADTAPLMPKVLILLPTISAGQLYRIM